MAGLSTHVLDTAKGRPATGMEIMLWLVNPLKTLNIGKERLSQENSKSKARRSLLRFQSDCQLLKTVITNQDGRTDEPLLSGEDFQAGFYEIVFAVGDYFAQEDSSLSESHPFLDLVPIRFGIADIEAHYHVPLLVSPWAYSTYRGS